MVPATGTAMPHSRPIQRRRPLPLLALAAMLVAVLAAFAAPAGAAESTSERIAARARAYEHGLDAPFAQVKPGLERWAQQQRDAALGGLRALLAQHQGDAKLFVAYHLLRLDPKEASARAAFAEAKVDPPYAEDGAPAAPFVLATPVDAGLAEQVARTELPSFDVIRDVMALKSPLLAPYWDAQGQALQSLKVDLVALKEQGMPGLSMQTLAYYYPQAKDVVKWYKAKGQPVPTSRWWVSHADQFLLDHEFAGVDCLQYRPKQGVAPLKGTAAASAAGETFAVSPAAWAFLPVRSARIEAVIASRDGLLPVLVLGDEGGGGVRIAMAAKGEITAVSLPGARPLGKATVAADLTKSTPIEIEIRDRRLAVSVGGMPAITADLPRTCALKRFAVEGRSVGARSLRVRFLGARGTAAAIAGVAPTPPAEPAPERRQELDKPISVAFNDTPVEDAITVIARLAGVAVELDESGQLLKDVPVTLEAKDMRLASVLECLERQTDLRAKATAKGITLSWTK